MNGSAGRQDFDQVTQFLADLGQVGDGLGKFRPDQFPEAFAQPMHRHLDRAFTDTQLCRRLGMGESRQFTHQPRLEHLKLLCFAFGDEFLLSRVDGTVHYRQGPLAIEVTIGRQSRRVRNLELHASVLSVRAGGVE